MTGLLIAPVTIKGQVTLPKPVRTALHLKGPNMIAFRLERNGKVELVPIEIKEKEPFPYTDKEWAKIERLAAAKGKRFQSANAARKHLKNL